MRAVLVVILLLVGAVGRAEAQTSTPTPTGTATPTATATLFLTPTGTPELSVLWTLPPPVTTGTPQPGQDVILTYTVDIDQAVTGVLLFTVLILLWVVFVVALLRGWI